MSTTLFFILLLQICVSHESGDRAINLIDELEAKVDKVSISLEELSTIKGTVSTVSSKLATQEGKVTSMESQISKVVPAVTAIQTKLNEIEVLKKSTDQNSKAVASLSQRMASTVKSSTLDEVVSKVETLGTSIENLKKTTGSGNEVKTKLQKLASEMNGKASNAALTDLKKLVLEKVNTQDIQRVSESLGTLEKTLVQKIKQKETKFKKLQNNFSGLAKEQTAKFEEITKVQNFLKSEVEKVEKQQAKEVKKLRVSMKAAGSDSEAKFINEVKPLRNQFNLAKQSLNALKEELAQEKVANKKLKADLMNLESLMTTRFAAYDEKLNEMDSGWFDLDFSEFQNFTDLVKTSYTFVFEDVTSWVGLDTEHVYAQTTVFAQKASTYADIAAEGFQKATAQAGEYANDGYEQTKIYGAVVGEELSKVAKVVSVVAAQCAEVAKSKAGEIYEQASQIKYEDFEKAAGDMKEGAVKTAESAKEAYVSTKLYIKSDLPEVDELYMKGVKVVEEFELIPRDLVELAIDGLLVSVVVLLVFTLLRCLCTCCCAEKKTPVGTPSNLEKGPAGKRSTDVTPEKKPGKKNNTPDKKNNAPGKKTNTPDRKKYTPKEKKAHKKKKKGQKQTKV